MNEVLRLKELKDFQILDTPFEKKLNDFTSIAAALCDTPISLISFIDQDRVWFKAKTGLDFSEIHRDNSFSTHLVDNQLHMLVIDDVLQDPRFGQTQINVKGEKILYYAGVPLITKTGAVIGSLSVMDFEKRDLSKQKLEALTLLTNEVMEYLESRKMMLSQSDKINRRSDDLKNFSDQSSTIFMQIEVLKNGKIVIGFLSEAIQYLNSSFSLKYLKDHPKELLKMVFEDDYELVLKAMVQAFVNSQSLNIEFRAEREDKSICWYKALAKTEVREDNRVIWYASFEDVSTKKMYINTLEQMSFDISHILRKPITTLLSIISVIEIETDLDQDGLKMYAGYLKSVGEELNTFTKTLNENYHDMWMNLKSERKPNT